MQNPNKTKTERKRKIMNPSVFTMFLPSLRLKNIELQIELARSLKKAFIDTGLS